MCWGPMALGLSSTGSNGLSGKKWDNAGFLLLSVDLQVAPIPDAAQPN